jgi:hypothetical protein
VVQVNDSGVVRDQTGHVLVDEKGQLACPDKRCRAKVDLRYMVAQLVASGQLSLDEIAKIAFATEVIKVTSDQNDPAQIHNQWVDLYKKWGLPKEMRVSKPNFSRDFVQKMKSRQDSRIPIFVHPQLTFPLLGKTFPQMRSWSLEETAGVVDSQVLTGWLFVEEALEAPNCKTNEEQLAGIFQEQGAIGLTETSYVIFGQYCQEVHGRYPDLERWSRLLGSSYRSRVLYAFLNSNGSLFVSLGFAPVDVVPYVGGRSAVKSGN